MKTIQRLALLLLLASLASCGSRKHIADRGTAATDPETAVVPPTEEGSLPSQAQPQEQTCVTARLRMTLQTGSGDASLGGTLRMKRDDVIQLSLVTFDKMGKRYVKASYGDVPFLRSQKVDFDMIQSYFWDEQTRDVPGWERSDFVAVADRRLPTHHNITIQSGSRTVKAALTLSSLSTDANWQTRTEVPSRYAQVPVDELLSRILNLLK